MRRDILKKVFKILTIISLIALLFSLVGCSNDKSNVKADENQVISQEDEQTDSSDEDTVDISEDDTKELDPKESIDLSLKPNESGEIMVLMYHGIGETEAEWVRTVENFKKDLKILYEKGYRPISLTDYVSNNIDIEAGYTPVVLTFDDGHQNNFNIIEENGKLIVDPNSAVGIMEEFHREHPDFPLKASFFLFGSNPFRQKDLVEYKLKYLVEKGFDVGNHTIGHNNMSETNDPEKIQKYIAEQAKLMEDIIPGYKINTYALAYGARPKDKELYKYLQMGQYDGFEYENIAILNVGWYPGHSPISTKFEPYSIPRVRASETKVDGVGLYDWLAIFDKNPERRYISDGNPDIVTVPKRFEERIDTDKLNGKEIYIYDEDEVKE